MGKVEKMFKITAASRAAGSGGPPGASLFIISLAVTAPGQVGFFKQRQEENPGTNRSPGAHRNRHRQAMLSGQDPPAS